MKRNIFLKIVIIFSVLIIARPVSADCSWKGRSITTGVAGGTAVVSDPFGGCSESEHEAQSNETCSGNKPADKDEIGYGGKNTHTTYVCCCPLASATTQKEPKFTAPNLQIPIPNLAFSNKVNCEQNDDMSWACYVPWLSQYIIAIFNYGLSIAGILAAIVLMAGGLLWLTSAGNPKKVSQAKELIISSIIGLVILFSSYVILVQINPDLIQMKSVRTGVVQEELMPDTEMPPELAGTNPYQAGCVATHKGDLSVCEAYGDKMPGGLVLVENKYVEKNAAEKYKNAMDCVAQKNKNKKLFAINSAFRSAKRQLELKKSKLKTPVAPPCCSSHGSGQAFDIMRTDGKKMDWGYNDSTGLTACMNANGLYAKVKQEAWHFSPTGK